MIATIPYKCSKHTDDITHTATFRSKIAVINIKNLKVVLHMENEKRFPAKHGKNLLKFHSQVSSVLSILKVTSNCLK